MNRVMFRGAMVWDGSGAEACCRRTRGAAVRKSIFAFSEGAGRVRAGDDHR